nr:FAD-dependent oxidoreductase [Lachnospira sp.]
MIQISQIRLKPDSPETALHQAVYKALRLSSKDTCRIEIAKQSIDSRHKPDILYIYSVHVSDILLNGKKPVDEAAWIKKLKNRDITPVTQKGYTFPAVSRQILKEEDRPVIIGFGPAGMFAALKLAEAGLRPIVFERGDSIEQRKKEVEAFWQGGALNTESNVQFGEGGAGTFSDGKLNTAIKDPTGRIHEVLRIFAEFGADSRILYVNKPHIGTDVLAKVVQNIRKKITACGGEVHFQTKLTAIHEKDGAVNGITVFDRAENKSFTHACNTVCLAIGHSARDTFEMLLAQGISMQPKAFAVGVRMEHPQSFINQNAYGDCHYKLPAADYKVTFQTST